MRMSLTGGVAAIILLIAVVIGYSTFFTVDQTSQALVVRLGKPVRVITDPGLNVKMPFIDSVIYIDKRLLAVESPAQEVIAASQDSRPSTSKPDTSSSGNSSADTSNLDNTNIGAEAGERLVVDAFARYRITDPLRYYQTVGPAGASTQLAILLDSTLRSVLGGATLNDVVRNERELLMAQMREDLDKKAHEFGIDVIDVRIRRADLPEQNSEAVYARMQTERQREAAAFRAEGSQKAQAIHAKADRDVKVIIADANSQAETIRGLGDGEANAIFAQAYGQDPGFFAFYRSMRAYEQSMQHGNTNLVLGPDSNFFRFFGNPSGRPLVEAGTPHPAPGAHSGMSAPPSGRHDDRAAVTDPAK